MANSTKTVKAKPATPARTRAKAPVRKAVPAPAKALAKKPARSALAATPANAAAEKKPIKPIKRALAHRKAEVSPEQRRSYVEIAAYFIAERHGFTPGCEHDDWVVAEAEINRINTEGLLRTES